MNKDHDRLYDLTDTNSPAESLAEIKNILLLIDPPPDPSPIEKVYSDVLRLFKGEFPGYRASNTKYHNLAHTSSTALAAARLIHGLHVQGQVFSPRIVQLCLIGALFHDTGLIQTEEEMEGTGAQYTIGHEERSIAVMEKYLSDNGYSQKDIRDCSHVIKCTDLFLPIEDIPFESEEVRTMGKVLGTADLVAQMADRDYQEKLPLLFLEFHCLLHLGFGPGLSRFDGIRHGLLFFLFFYFFFSFVNGINTTQQNRPDADNNRHGTQCAGGELGGRYHPQILTHADIFKRNCR